MPARSTRPSLAPASAQLAPGTAFYLVFLVAPLGLLLAYSFFRAGFFETEPAFTLESYRSVFGDSLYRDVFLNTVWVAAVVAVIVVVLAYPFAYFATFVFPMRRELLLFFVLVSLFAGYLVRIYAWRTILGREGVINSALTSLGVIDEPLSFLLYSRFAVILTFVSILMPFAILPLYASMQNVPRELLEAARDLGAGAIARFRTVILPLTRTGARTAFAFAFLLSAGDFVTPTLLGGAKGLMVGNVIADQFGASSNLPLGAALGVVVIVVAGVVILAVDRGLKLACAR
jgi:spermidine/putrescine transport system permease protein